MGVQTDEKETTEKLKETEEGKDKVQNDTDDEKGNSRSRECLKKLLKFLFSHIGLSAMVIAYCVAGGFIFQHLEERNEQMECEAAYKKYSPAENDTINKLWTIATSHRIDQEEQALEAFQKVLHNYRSVVLDLNYDGRNCSNYGEKNGPVYQWSFSGSLLFSVTVITTVGYGNIAPKTNWGRLVCIAYAVLGIPLMLLCLANIGDVLADIFRFVYLKVCCCGCFRKKKKNKVESAPENDTGRKSPEAWKEQFNQAQAGNVAVVDDDEDDEDDVDANISVPLTVTMLIIGFYIFFGAMLFGVWEDWTPLEASYFCFVTISTIGFGDVVPGSSAFESAADQWKMVGTAVYMLFGMAILSMCFSLIQEEIVAKFKWLGEKLGIVEKEKPPEEEEEKEIEETKPEREQSARKQSAKSTVSSRSAASSIPRKGSVSPAPLSDDELPLKED